MSTFSFARIWAFMASVFPSWFAVAALVFTAVILLLIIFKIVAFVFDVIPFL